MAEHEKDIIYLEHDAEVTEAVEKLKAAEGDTVRIVVPGRSALLQSVVNLRLLKKAAQSKKKELVLVTTDRAAMALAGKLEIAIAKNVHSAAHVITGEPEPTRSPLADDNSPKESDGDDGPPVHHFDNETSKKKSAKKQRGGKIPDYNRFQLAIWIGCAVVALILLGWLSTAFLQTATVKVQANADKQSVDTKFTLSATASGATTVQAKVLELPKDLSQSYSATGQIDKGTKATGTLTLKNCEDSDPHSLPAGSKLTTSGKTFVTNTAVTISEGSFSGGGTVCNSDTTTVGVTAAENGDGYNFSAASFAITALSGKFTATGTTSGGVSKKVTVVSQSDIDNAQKTAIETAKAAALIELKDKARSSQKVFDDTFQTAVTSATPSQVADTEASGGNLSMKVKFTVYAAETTDLEQLVKDALASQLSNGAEVLDAGLDQAEFVQTKADKGDYSYGLKTIAFIGQPIDKTKLAQQVAGKDKKEVSTIAKQYPNVTGATVDAWPLVSNMPLNAGNIKVEVVVTK
ncbi:hypothetical protein IT415_02305 [bacterium]|nr:hypothetical protein [bacterium]